MAALSPQTEASCNFHLKDIESRAATIQHLQQALKAKSQTIEILFLKLHSMQHVKRQAAVGVQ